MVENSSDPRLVLYMWRTAFGVLLSTNISLPMSTVKFSVNMHFFVGHVSCLRILIVILRNNKLHTLWFLHRMRPYGQTPPLDKCEQFDLKHIKAMLQNVSKIPQGGRRLSSSGPWTILSEEKEPIARNRSEFAGYSGNKTQTFTSPK